MEKISSPSEKIGMVEKRKPLLQIADSDLTDEAMEIKRKKFLEHLDKRHAELKAQLESKGMLIPPKNKENKE